MAKKPKFQIAFDREIYIDRLFPKITKRLVTEEYQEDSLHDFEMFYMPPKDLTTNKNRILENVYSYNEEFIKVRVLSTRHMLIQRRATDRAMAFFEGTKSALHPLAIDKSNYNENFDGVVIYINGGDIIPDAYNNAHDYLIPWADSLNKVVFSIEYKHTPQDPVPSWSQ